MTININKKRSYRRVTARRAMSVNSCYVSRGVEEQKHKQVLEPLCRGWRPCNFAEILGIKSPWAIVWRCLRYLTFSRFGTVPACDRQTDGHTTSAYTALA